MFRDERSLAKRLAETIKSCSQVKNIVLGSKIPKESYEDILSKYFNSYAPMFMPKPDIIIITEDYEKTIDEWLIIAIELKYFKREDKKYMKQWRNAYREFGQPLRYHICGFDSTVLWHVFERNINDNLIEAYSSIITEVIKRLKLPVVYFSTKITEEMKLLPFEPLKFDKPKDVCYIISWIINCCRNIKNPLLPQEEKILERRRALKVILKVP